MRSILSHTLSGTPSESITQGSVVDARLINPAKMEVACLQISRHNPIDSMDLQSFLCRLHDGLGLVGWLTVGFVAILVLQLGRAWWRLRHIPGPFLASLTNLYRMSWVPTTRAHLILQDVHKKYGEVVRIGPNMVSFSNPEAIPTVYPMRAGLPKVFLSGFCITRPFGWDGRLIWKCLNPLGRLLRDFAPVHQAWWRITRRLQHN